MWPRGKWATAVAAIEELELPLSRWILEPLFFFFNSVFSYLFVSL